MHRKTREADDELTSLPGMPPEALRAPPELPAAVDRMWRGMQRRREAVEKMDPTLFGQLDSADPAAIVERVARIEATLQALIESREYVLRAGSLEIDLIMRGARRGERSIELLPREFRLLEYMMRRTNQLLTRATLLAEVWNYKFVPRTNLVDVHMGRLRHKVDWPDESPMIHCVRGAGFILRAPA
jgi:DNA-binding winged helix-turn-helix (wHTH) protein